MFSILYYNKKARHPVCLEWGFIGFIHPGALPCIPDALTGDV
jgi:hypothetical protein